MSVSTHVALVGAGPGDEGLLTCEGASLIESADIIVYDYLSNPRLLGRARADARLVYVGKKGFSGHITQPEINDILIDLARELDAAFKARLASRPADAGRAESGTRAPLLVRLKGGDPFVFGRGGEEALALREAGIPFSVVPGITSGIAAPAYAGIPVTHRGVASSVTFVTGNEDPTKDETALDWESLAGMVKAGGTLCVYMGMRNLSSIAGHLAAQGVEADCPCALVRWGTTREQRTLVAPLSDAARRAEEAGFTAPVMTVVGQVARLREDLSWFEDAPLFGRRILVTRSRTQASAFTRRLEALGAQVVEVPTIDIAPPESFDALDASLNALDGFSWVVFTSANGVEAFFERLRRRTAPPHDARALAHARIAAIGPATADALRAHGIEADAVPHEYRAEAVFDAMRERGLDADDAVLIPRAQVAREALPEMLAGIGCAVTVAPAYRTVVPGTSADAAKAALADGVDAVTFTSSSTAENLVALLGEDAPALLADARLFSIGPITTATLERLGFPPASTASSYTIPGLVDTLLEAFASPDETAFPRKDHR